MTIVMLLHVVAAAALALAVPPPDHPITGQPVTPTWTWTYDGIASDNALLAVTCHVPPKGRTRCHVTGLTPEGVRIMNAWADRR